MNHPVHKFVVRLKGSKLACGYPYCGARESDPVHNVEQQLPPPRPKRRKRGDTSPS